MTYSRHLVSIGQRWEAVAFDWYYDGYDPDNVTEMLDVYRRYMSQHRNKYGRIARRSFRRDISNTVIVAVLICYNSEPGALRVAMDAIKEGRRIG